MRLAGNMKLYLIDPKVSIEQLIKSSQHIDEANFILETVDQKKIKIDERPHRSKKINKKKDDNINEKRAFYKFISTCTVKEEGSYVTIQELHEAYVNWILENHVGDPVSLVAFGKYLNSIINVPSLQGKSLGQRHHIYLNINLKTTDKTLTKDAVGEIYKFYKLHFVKDSPPSIKIPLDEIYEVYENWCEEQGTQPVWYNTFSKNTRILMGSSSVEFHGRIARGRRRWLLGYRFKKPDSK